MDIMRVEGLISDDVLQLDAQSIFDVLDGLRFVLVILGIVVSGGVENPLLTILISVWVEGGLLFRMECQPRLCSTTRVTYICFHWDSCGHVSASGHLGCSDEG